MSPLETAAAERALRQQTHRLETLNEIALAVSVDHDLERIVQKVTDAATELTGAEFGAFFYNVLDQLGARYTLYTLSGAPRSAFEKFGMPRNTAIFDTTFRGSGVIRSDDIRTDPRYGKSAPHHGMPEGHLPVVSYLAVPVISRSGEVHGGLFFGHREPGVFTPEAEDIVKSMAAHAAIAIDNLRLFEAKEQLAAIVESSDDAIVSKSLDGIIKSWNRGAELLFGYTPEEVVGRSITVLIPEDRHHEEKHILGRIRRGDRVDHYETVRRRKDGTLVPVSITVSPVKAPDGRITGASKIGRDISERKRAEERQRLLVAELHHRVKNLLTVADGIVSLSARSARGNDDLAPIIRNRLGALAGAQSLLLAGLAHADAETGSTTLGALVETLLAPFGAGETGRVVIDCPDVPLRGSGLSSLALLLHEFATNAAKYGALSTDQGHVKIECVREDGTISIVWAERGGPPISAPPERTGFGTRFAEAAVRGELQGDIAYEWKPEGLTIRLSVARDPLS